MNYSLGLDIGITSVGWAVLDLDKKKVTDLGVRLFTVAENPKDGSSLALPRRMARSARRRTRRKRQRMNDIKRLIVSDGVISQKSMDALFSHAFVCSPWELRAAGLNRCLSAEEWARVLIHIAKHRGFKSNRNSVEEESKAAKESEEGKAKEGMKANSELLKVGNEGRGYRTVGEMVYNDPKFADHKRNKGGDYSHTINRGDLQAEVRALFEAQRGFENKFASADFEAKYLEIFGRQLPFASGDILEKMIGYCTLEPSCKRAPKAAWTAERFILLSKLSNMRVIVDGRRCELSSDKMKIIENLAYKNQKVTYKQIRKAIASDEDWVFDNLPSVRRSANKESDPEAAVFIELKAFHAFRKAITAALGEDYWNNLVTTKPQLLDILASALTFRKTDEEITSYLTERKIEPELIKAVLPLNFSGVISLSVEAINKLLPFMEERGCRYDEACELAGYCHYDPAGKSKRSLTLPVPDWEELRNPVVVRAIAQVRKVVNAITKKYGAPLHVQIELARDLSRSKEERDEIAKEQDENRAQREKMSQEYEHLYGYKPNGLQLEKFRLWKEQSGFCPYTGEYIKPNEAFMGEDGSYAEIDHIIPYSRSFDDSLTNKVLVMGSANRNKKNMTPYEYFGKEGRAWDEFTARVDAYVKNKRRAERLKRKDFGDEESGEMKERCLGDTRYITKYVAGWIESNLLFADPEIKKPVTRINGRATATLRRHWGINALKDRKASDLHHALDACVIAAATPSIVKNISDYSSQREMSLLSKESPEGHRTRLPEPWPHFRKEVEARLSDDPVGMIKTFELTNYTAEELEKLKPIFVSRKPDRKAGGAAHQETIRSAKYVGQGYTAVKTPLGKIKKSVLEYMVGKDRDTALYEALKKRLSEYSDDPKKAFKEEFRKPTKNGDPGPVVRSIKILTPGTSGVDVCGGIAANGEMVRVDVYTKNGKYYLIPYYVDDIAKKQVKNRAIVANKSIDEWEIIDKSFEFLFSIYKNDLLKIIDSKNSLKFGYYVGCHSGTGALNMISPSGDVEWEGIGARTAKLIEKYQVDVLGEYHKVSREKPPHELA